MAGLEALLDTAREALLDGDILKLAALAGELEAATLPRDPAALHRSRAKAGRNACAAGGGAQGPAPRPPPGRGIGAARPFLDL